MAPPEEVRAQLARCGQSHLLRFWAELGPAQRAALLAALPPGLGEHCRLAAAAGARQRGPPERLDGRMEPLPGRLLGSARRSGLAALERWEPEKTSCGRRDTCLCCDKCAHSLDLNLPAKRWGWVGRGVKISKQKQK
uniref:Uncharacterized protein n=1 Tax=Accipiter nisus TaxID=211598 RepID=A0A8B9M8L2_9AVES